MRAQRAEPPLAGKKMSLRPTVRTDRPSSATLVFLGPPPLSLSLWWRLSVCLSVCLHRGPVRRHSRSKGSLEQVGWAGDGLGQNGRAAAGWGARGGSPAALTSVCQVCGVSSGACRCGSLSSSRLLVFSSFFFFLRRRRFFSFLFACFFALKSRRWESVTWSHLT